MRLLSLFIVVLLTFGAALTASAQYAPATLEEGVVAEPPSPPLRVHLGLEGVFSNRSFSATSRDGALEYTAPMAAGLRVSGAFHPMALLLQERGPADGIAFYADTMRHSLLTEVPVRAEGRTLLVDVPTRYTATHFGLLYDFRATPELVLTPRIGMQRASYSLGFNRLINTVAYSGIDLGAGLTWHHPSRLVIGLEGRLRPAMNP